MRRPSRYAESDKLYGFAATEFGDYVGAAILLEKVSLWVGSRLDLKATCDGDLPEDSIGQLISIG